MFEVTLEQSFAAAHLLRDYYGKDEPLHGHNFKVQVTIAGPRLNSMGMLIDFLVLKKVLEQAISGIDHVFLNQVPPFDKVNPSAENVAKYLFEIVEAGLPNDADAPVTVAHVKVWETDLASAVYRK